MEEKLIYNLTPDFQLNNEAGSFVQLVHCDWSQINVISSLKGSYRGGHYHKENKEAFYIITGKLKLALEKEGIEEKHIFEQGAFFLIVPFAKHNFHFIEDTIMISMYDKGVEHSDGTKDIFGD